MTEEIKEILDYIDDRIIPNEKWDKIKDYITNLQQELQKANDTIKELRDNNALDLLKISINSQYINTQNENIRLRQENETLKAKLEIGKTCGFCPYYDYKSRCEKAVEYLENLWSFPSGNFEVAINKEENKSIDIDGNKYIDNLLNILNGSDENE